MTDIPAPRLDHVVINVEAQLDAAAATYAKLGFSLTERGHHTLGSSNHLAIFCTDYLELLGYEPARVTESATLWQMPTGLAGLVFKPGPDAGFRDAIVARGVPAEPSREFSRPVEVDGTPQDARFRVTHLAPEVAFNGRVFFCHHFTPELVWRPEWQRHANGTTGLAEFVIASATPEESAAPYRRLFGDAPFTRTEDGITLQAGSARLSVLTPAAAAARFGDALPALPADGSDRMVALVLRTASLAQARAALAAGGVDAREQDGMLLVAAPDACGLALGFVE